MDKAKQDYLSPIQIAAVVSSTIIGVVVLTLPRIAAQAAQHGAILSVLMAGIVSLILTIVAAYVGKKFPNQTFIEYSMSILGRLPGKLLGALAVIYFIFISGITLRSFADTLKVFALPRTPTEFIMATMLIVVIYMIHNGIGAIAKICETFLPLIVIALALVIVLNFPDFQVRFLYPLFTNGLTTTFFGALKGVPKLISAFLGFEAVLFIIPFMQKPEKAIPYAAAGTALPSVIYTGLVAMSIGTFGLELTKKMLYPTITLARSITFPGAFAERFDILFGVLWILAAFTSISMYYYLASLGVTRLLRLKNFRPFIFILLPFVYLVAITPQNLYQINALVEIMGYIGIAIVLSPFPLLLISRVKNKGGKKHAEAK